VEIKTNKGVLKYRLPDISEGYDYLSLVDVINTSSDVFIIKSKIIKKMGELLEFKELGYETYQDVLNDKENMREALSEISKNIFDDIIELLGKKI
jgi:RecJ-like exonuclease